MLPLFKHYPELEKRLAHLALGRFPTPVERLPDWGGAAAPASLHIKRDDLSGTVYGGNKVRKLEFLLAAALRAGAADVITLGFAGSNHALATALYARQVGLRCEAMLLPQVNARYVRRNLLASHHCGAELHACPNALWLGLKIVFRLLRGRLKDGRFPRFIPGGGSCPLGVIGYVNAGFELREQVLAGALPEPDLVHVAMGSMGTTAGLMLGLRAAGLKSRVVPVRVIERRLASPRGLLRLLRRTGELLRALDPTFPRLEFARADVASRDDCLGAGYARFTANGVQAAERMRREAGIVLNGTYTAKAFAAVLDDIDRQALRGQAVLFWNTYNSIDLADMTAGVDYHDLPRGLQRYFEEEVQPLDRDGAVG
jgi:1-aminocyclopropane-1-carboxylate deaminase/D-cysteine desulfhydrase-like pyridoxal-dependent ACC family enzyme